MRDSKIDIAKIRSERNSTSNKKVAREVDLQALAERVAKLEKASEKGK